MGQRSMSAMSTELLKLFYNVDDFAPNQNKYISLSRFTNHYVYLPDNKKKYLSL